MSDDIDDEELPDDTSHENRERDEEEISHKEFHRIYEENSVDKWRNLRLAVGRDRYGDSHLGRDIVIDIAEELMDAKNLLESLIINRLSFEDGVRFRDIRDMNEYKELNRLLDLSMYLLSEIDREIPSKAKTDDEAEERIGEEVILST